MLDVEQTKQMILQRMLEQSPADIDVRQGSITYDLLSPAAIELAQAYMQLEHVLQAGFADTTYGNYLDLRCQEMGITRKAAVKASGTITFLGPEGTVIPQGTVVSTELDLSGDALTFITTEEGIIQDGTATVWAEAEQAGSASNVHQGEITLVTGPLNGILSIAEHSAFAGGADTESDEALLQRYYERVRKPVTSGNSYQYLQWSKEIGGIADARVYPLWDGPGTVKIVLLDEERTAPPPQVVEEVAAYIESVRPIGAAVTVEGATEVPIDIAAQITLADGYSIEDAEVEIAERVSEYLKSLAFVDPTVRYTQIANAILNTDAVLDYDHTSLTVNGAMNNVIVDDTAGEVAVLGTVSLS